MLCHTSGKQFWIACLCQCYSDASIVNFPEFCPLSVSKVLRASDRGSKHVRPHYKKNTADQHFAHTGHWWLSIWHYITERVLWIRQVFRHTWPHVFKDTEAAVSNLEVPEVDAEVVCRQVGLIVTVDWDRVDMVGVSVGEHPPWTGFHHEVHGY